MKIYIDTREKQSAISGIIQYFDKHDIEWERKTLKTGDYMLDCKSNVVIDRKHSLSELAHNLLSHDKARFYREVRRAREDGIRLIVLCEESKIHNLEDVTKWTPRFGKISGRTLADAIFRLTISYGIDVYYCNKRSTGKRIIELLTEEPNEIG